MTSLDRPPEPLSVAAVTPVRPPSFRRTLRRYSADGVIRTVGCGLVAMFLLDLIPIGMSYRPWDPQSDATLVTEILERIAVPLIGLALIFGLEVPELSRPERALRKFLAYFNLIGVIGCASLSLLTLTASVRLYNRGAALADQRAEQRATALKNFRDGLPKLTDAQLLPPYVNLVRLPDAKHPAPAPSIMRKEMADAIPPAIDTAYATARVAKSQGRKTQWATSGKYIADGLISAVLFFLLWEASYEARQYRIRRIRDQADLKIEGAVVGAFQRMSSRMEGVRFLPNPEDYATFRRLRRRWRHWRGRSDRSDP